MAIYLIPIFCFGLVITGIVFLGVQQAADLAKDLARRQREMELSDRNTKGVTPARNTDSSEPLASLNHR